MTVKGDFRKNPELGLRDRLKNIKPLFPAVGNKTTNSGKNPSPLIGSK
jgi:hypothetical protein